MDQAAATVVVPAAGALLAALLLWLGARAGRRKMLLDDVPTSKTTGVFLGLNELRGRVVSERPLRSRLAERDCALYEFEVAERWSRIVTETYTGPKGRLQTRTRRESGWTALSSGGEMQPFELEDDHGRVRVRPEGADVEPATLLDRTCGPADPLYYGKGPRAAVANSDHVRRFRETGLPVGAEVYVIGQARERRDAVAPEIAESRGAPMFLISVRGERSVSRGLFLAWLAWNVLAIGAAVGGFLVRDAAEPAGLREWTAYLPPGCVALAAAAAVWVGMVHNALVNLRHRVDQAWSLVDVQLRRRHDLIPNLVRVVKGHGGHEAALQQAVAELRGQADVTPPGDPGPDYRPVAARLAAVVEGYPDLGAERSFAALFRELADTETRIALARGYYNEIAAFHDARLETVPHRWIAALAGLRRRGLLEAEPGERAAPELAGAFAPRPPRP